MAKNTVGANGQSIVTKKSKGKVTCFPNVCKTPVGSGVVPIPYPSMAKSRDLKKGSKSVKIDGAPVCLKDSYFSKSIGDEAGTAKGMTGEQGGTAEPVTYSPNVTIEGKPLVRALDLFTSNDKNTPPAPIIQEPIGTDPTQQSSDEEKTFTCDWKNCKGEHSEEIEYPDRENGKTIRGEYTGVWLEPWMYLGSGKSSSNITIKHYIKEVKKKRIGDAKSLFGTGMYPTDKHHLIPVSSISKCSVLRHNAELVGWDINHADNGITLPYFVTDIFRHDLQSHRTSHPSYSRKVERDLKQLQKKCNKYCETERQIQLLFDLQEISDDCCQLIREWKWPLRTTAFKDRVKSYKQAKIKAPFNH